ncbi:helix-turn-helix domain-containing protein [Crossiella sp. CA-258035]|uniref:PucR family transcriptional regulator n=1 Tax=Crossiella sp. CA-258035 TaxID=2981138 RepID=UPI0024BC5DB0|nr:helix-turn-helix domain-containing protein [Crossiella sp. CA-258035]WHT22758.1 helix-turn-helix domain-containing protein [Crossiella sp. CA-258035]
MSVLNVDPVARIEDLVVWSDELVQQRSPGDREPLRLLLRDIAALYVHVARHREQPVAHRERIQAAARTAGVAGDELREVVRRLTDEAIRRTPEPAPLLAAAHAVLADLACAGPPRLARVRRLLNGEPPEREIRLPAPEYTVVVFRAGQLGPAGVAGLLAELDGQLVDGQEVLAGCHGDHAVLLVPGSTGEQRVRRLVADLLPSPLCAAMATCGPSTLTAGYDQAANVLALALAAARGPGLYGIDDFLMEYAAMRDPAVSARLVAIVRPLLGSDRLYETLTAFVRCGHNRGRTARELFVHRTTVDYRIRRIAEITGYDPTSGQGGQVLAAAVTIFALRAQRTAKNEREG